MTRRAHDVAAPLLLVGTSHHLAPVAIRERLAAKGGERAAERLATVFRERVGPTVVLETCNRLEVYCWTDRPRAAQALIRVLREWSGLRRADLAPYLYSHRGLDAAQHLIRVAAGLDSLAVGESEVLGQVRDAWETARRAREAALPPEVNSLFRHAIRAARGIRRQGLFDRHPSIAAVAVDAASGALGDLAGRSAAVLGAGTTGRQVARHLLAAGAGQVVLLNRSRGRLAEVRGDLSRERIRLATLDALPTTLAESDVLVCATASSAPIVSRALVESSLPRRDGRRLTIIDIAVPRDVEPTTRALPGVALIDLDDLAAGCTADADTRRAALDNADRAAREAADAYAADLRLRRSVPDIVAIRRHAERVRATALARARRRLGRLSGGELETIERLTRSIVRQLLHPPTVALRRTASDSRGDQLRAAIVAALTDTSDPEENLGLPS